ncbi:hypothetical protein D8I35_05255 [Corticibacter populi]|uniref:Uncharacterized protein n=1 Tax=Corticibacter populi TaxID=1550736 RepID=A0A3M6QZM9_9BURK|nr:hypothetical protein [Corticibacter populi]RMX08486.1 hypothetical protein D8I35_05255 [Corticibacter populi]RZS35799.1 hypothetical protein EV687_0878 [Corticibacter populi]
MHALRPYGRFVEDSDLSADDAAAVAYLTRRLTNFKHVSDLEALRWRRVLPSGRVAVLHDMGGVFKVVVREGSCPSSARSVVRNGGYVPMLFSGVPTTPIVRQGEKLQLALTSACRRRLHQYEANSAAPGLLALERFTIEYGPAFQSLKPLGSGEGFVYTQYHAQHPSWYSGAMQALVQCVAGYGRQDVSVATSDPYARYETAVMDVPREYLRDAQKAINGVVLPGFFGQPSADGQIQYDFHHSRSHGLTFGDDGKPWLIRVNAAGVYAMPLPMVPLTTTTAFRAYVEAVGDAEIVTLLDMFGGMPSGEDFPQSSSVFAAWVRAGGIVKIADVGDFYSHYALYGACGWSFADHGREGYNTCLEARFSDEVSGEGMVYANGYKLSLRIGATRFDGKMPQALMDLNTQTSGQLASYTNTIVNGLGDAAAERDAILYKIYRTPAEELSLRIYQTTLVESEVNYWRNRELSPIADVAGGVARVASGPYIPGISFKVPEPSSGGCVDIVAPIERGKLAGYPDRWDTIFFGYYSGDSLKVVKQFSDDNRTYSTAEQSNYEDCMIVGSWSKTSAIASSSAKGGLYSSDFDYRETLPNSNVTVTDVVGMDLGYDSIPRILFPYPVWSGLSTGGVFRYRYYSTRTTIKTVYDGQSIGLGACVPFLSRNALLFAHAKWNNGRTVVSDELKWSWISDPNSYAIRGNWYSNKPTEYRIVDERFGASSCSDFADSGSWGPGLGEVTSWAQSILNGPTARYGWSLGTETGPYGGGSDPKIRTHSTSTTTPPDEPNIGDVEWEQRGVMTVRQKVSIQKYREQSPTPGIPGASFREDATRNCLGDITYEVTSEGGARRGHTRFHGIRSMPFFIGVIHE